MSTMAADGAGGAPCASTAAALEKRSLIFADYLEGELASLGRRLSQEHDRLMRRAAVDKEPKAAEITTVACWSPRSASRASTVGLEQLKDEAELLGLSSVHEMKATIGAIAEKTSFPEANRSRAQDQPATSEVVVQSVASSLSSDSGSGSTAMAWKDPGGVPDHLQMRALESLSPSCDNATFKLLPVWQDISREMSQVSSRPSNSSNLNLRKGTTIGFADFGEDLVVGTYLEKLLVGLIMHPSSRFNLCWELIGLALVIRDIIVIPLHIIDPLDSTFTMVISWFARVFWAMDIMISFLTGFVTSQGIVAMNPRQIAKQYIWTRLPMDLLLVICDWSEVLAQDVSTGWNFLSMLRAMRLVRLTRLIKNQKKILEFMIRSEWLLLVAGVKALLLLLLALIHVLACLWYGLQPSESELLATEDREALIGGTLQKYIFCVHVMLSLFLGEHVAYPLNTAERLFIVLVLVFSFVVSAVFVGHLTTAMTRLQFIASERSSQFAALSNYLTDTGISRELAYRVQRNARHVLGEMDSHPPESSVALLELISDQLRAELHYEVHFRDLSVHPFFKHYNETNSMCMRSICHSAVSVLSFSRGDIIFSEFEVPSTPQFCLIVSGQLSYNQVALAVFQQPVKPNVWMSEMQLWTRWAHRGTAQAVEESRIMMVHAQRFAETVGMYRAARRYVTTYAQAFLNHLSKLDEHELTDIGEDITAWQMVKLTFAPDEICEGGRAFSSWRRNSAESVFTGLRRNSISIMPSTRP